jgi:peptide deformylase
VSIIPLTLKILQTGAPVLRQPAQPLTIEQLQGPGIRNLIELMRETMRDAPGVGLAAPQVGVGLQLAMIEDRAELLEKMPPEQLIRQNRRPVAFHVIVNPQLTLLGEPIESFEGCLSVAGFMAVVPRAERVRVECWDQHGEPQVIEAEGWYARILQHEIDHLNGTLYLDHMYTRSFMTEDYYRRTYSR